MFELTIGELENLSCQIEEKKKELFQYQKRKRIGFK
jgi:hypothetical protein